MNFYELLSVSNDASTEMIEQAYQDKIAELYVLKSTGGLDDEIFTARFNNFTKAYNTLIDENVRKEYDEYLSGKNRKPKKGILKKVAKGALAIACAATIVTAGYFTIRGVIGTIEKHFDNKPGTTQSDSSVLPNHNDVLPDNEVDSTVYERASKVVEQLNGAGVINEETSQPFTIDEVKKVIDYIDGSYTATAENGIDASNVNQVALLERKAINVAQQLKDAGIYNVKTSQPYTAEEIKDIIQYIDGVYALEGDEAISIVYDFLSMVVTPLNTQQIDNQTGNSYGEGSDYQYTYTGDYGSIMDENLVQARATTLVNELNAMNIINPVTCVPYTVDECVGLIKYANGVYVPATMEEIDVMHLNLLNLLISPLNTDEYLFHVVYASGNDDFKEMAEDAAANIKPVDFASAFCEYGQNGVYPLTQWMQEKREAIYTTTDREEINKIYVEVGQVMADIMKGNGCTITVIENGQEKTYKFTSEQILANHASAMLLTIDAQLIFANHYEVRDAYGKVTASTQSVWQVYNKFNGDEPDQVTLDEIQAWINNGCDYEWGIDEVLIDGQTFGQRIQGDMEGMAQNNYAMYSGYSLTK